MSGGALDWLLELRRRAERQAIGALRAKTSALEAARRAARIAAAGGAAGVREAAADLERTLRRATWADEEAARRAGEVARARAVAAGARAAAEGLRRLLDCRREALRALRLRRAEGDAGEEATGMSLRGRTTGRSR